MISLETLSIQPTAFVLIDISNTYEHLGKDETYFSVATTEKWGK